jgi:hypothetical protein
MHFIFGIFVTFLGCRYGWYLSNEPLHVAFGLTIEELEDFIEFSLASGRLSATAYAVEFAHAALSKGGQQGAGCFRRMG